MNSGGKLPFDTARISAVSFMLLAKPSDPGADTRLGVEREEFPVDLYLN